MAQDVPTQDWMNGKHKDLKYINSFENPTDIDPYRYSKKYLKDDGVDEEDEFTDESDEHEDDCDCGMVGHRGNRVIELTSSDSE